MTSLQVASLPPSRPVLHAMARPAETVAWARPEVDAWCILDAQHNVLMWNDHAADLLGRPRGALSGLNLLHLLTPVQGIQQERAAASVLNQGLGAVEMNLDLLEANGTALPVHVQVSALHDEAGARLLIRLRRQGMASEEGGRVEAAARRWGLTTKQRDVLQLVARGLSNKAAADQLGCAESTVELHMTAIFKKSGTKGRSLLLTHLFSVE